MNSSQQLPPIKAKAKRQPVGQRLKRRFNAATDKVQEIVKARREVSVGERLGTMMATEGLLFAPIETVRQLLRAALDMSGLPVAAAWVQPIWAATYRMTRPAIRLLFDIGLFIFKQWLAGTIIYSVGYLVPRSLGMGILDGFGIDFFSVLTMGWSWLTADQYFVPLLMLGGLFANQFPLPDRLTDFGVNAVEKVVGIPAGWIDKRLEEDGPGFLGAALASAGTLWLVSGPVLSALKHTGLEQGFFELSAKFSELAFSELPAQRMFERFGVAIRLTASYLGLTDRETFASIIRLNDALEQAVLGLFDSGKVVMPLMIAVLFGGTSIGEVIDGNVKGPALAAVSLEEIQVTGVLGSVLGYFTPGEFFKYYQQQLATEETERIANSSIWNMIKHRFSSVKTDSLGELAKGLHHVPVVFKNSARFPTSIGYWREIAAKPLVERIFLTLKVMAIIAAEAVGEWLGNNMALVFGLVLACCLLALSQFRLSTPGKAASKLEISAIEKLTAQVRALEQVSLAVELGQHINFESAEQAPAELMAAVEEGDRQQTIRQLHGWTKLLFAALKLENSSGKDKSAVARATLVQLYQRLVNRRAKLEILGQNVVPETSKKSQRVDAQLARASRMSVIELPFGSNLDEFRSNKTVALVG